MIEGSVLLPSLNRPALLFTAGFAVDLAPVERIADSFPATAYVGLESICFSSTARSMFVDVLSHTCVDGQDRWGNCPGILETWRFSNRG